MLCLLGKLSRNEQSPISVERFRSAHLWSLNSHAITFHYETSSFVTPSNDALASNTPTFSISQLGSVSNSNEGFKKRIKCGNLLNNRR